MTYHLREDGKVPYKDGARLRNLVLCLVDAWNKSYCHSGDDGTSVEWCIRALAQKELFGEVDLDNCPDTYELESLLRETYKEN